jgi:hypothetical protein
MSVSIDFQVYSGATLQLEVKIISFLLHSTHIILPPSSAFAFVTEIQDVTRPTEAERSFGFSPLSSFIQLEGTQHASELHLTFKNIKKNLLMFIILFVYFLLGLRHVLFIIIFLF